jgi:hypothetical protein
MNKWIKRLLVVLQIGGGFAGLVVIAQLVIMNAEITAISVMGNVIFGIIFFFGIVAGLVLIEDEKLGIVLSQIFQATQIPLLSSPIIVYRLICGFGVAVFWQGARAGFNYWFGCHYAFFLFDNAAWGIGVNIVALVLFIYLVRLRKRKPEGDTIADRPEAEIQLSDLNLDLPEQ